MENRSGDESEISIREVLPVLEKAQRQIAMLQKDKQDLLALLEERNAAMGKTVQTSSSKNCIKKDLVDLQPVARITLISAKGDSSPVKTSRATGMLLLTESYLSTCKKLLNNLKEFQYLWIVFPNLVRIFKNMEGKLSALELEKLDDRIFTTKKQERLCPVDIRLIRIVKFEDRAIHFEGLDVPDLTSVIDIIPYVKDHHHPLDVNEFLVTIMLQKKEFSPRRISTNSRSSSTASRRISTASTRTLESYNAEDSFENSFKNDEPVDISQIQDETAKLSQSLSDKAVAQQVQTTVTKVKQLQQCCFCDRTFQKMGMLKSHITKVHFNEKININSDEKSFACDLCGKKSTSQSNLNVHKKIHSRTFKCNICYNSYDESEQLDQHMNKHAVTIRSQCPACFSLFDRDVDYMKHKSNCANDLENNIERQFSAEMLNQNEAQKVTERRINAGTILLPLEIQNSIKENVKKLRNGTVLIPAITTNNNHRDEKQCDKETVDNLQEVNNTIKVHERKVNTEVGSSMNQNKIDANLDNTIITSQAILNDVVAEENILCNICERQFSHKKYLDAHKAVHLKEKPFKCKICYRGFSYKSNLTNHEKSHYKLKASYNLLGSTSKFLKQKKEFLHQTWKRIHQCNICKKLLQTASSLNKHKKIHMRKYQCKICHDGFEVEETYNKHMIKHNQKDDANKNGSVSFENNTSSLFVPPSININNLNSSEKVSIKIEPFNYPCRICKKIFQKKRYLIQHMVIHQEIKPYKCPTCYRDFRRRNDLQNHLKTVHHSNQRKIHNSERKIVVSSKMFIKKSNMLKHREIVKKKHRCPICKTGFEHLSSLKTHQKKIHTRPYSCKTCHYGFQTQILLDQHVVKKHKTLLELVYPCNICSTTFHEETQYQQHTLICEKSKNIVSSKAPISDNKELLCKCQKIFYSERAFMEHKVSCGSPQLGNLLNSTNKMQNPEAEVEPTGQCKHCHKIFKLKYLPAHERLHTDKKYSCPHCDKKFARNDYLKSHLRTNHSNKKTNPNNSLDTTLEMSNNSDAGFNFEDKIGEGETEKNENVTECNSIADASTKSSNSDEKENCEKDSYFKSQKRKLSTENSVVGDENCGATPPKRPFESTPNLRNSGKDKSTINPKLDRRIQCSKCPARFKSRTDLKEHMLIHPDEKPFQCTKCDKSFSKKYVFDVHFSKHSENNELNCKDISDKIFECKVCSKTFSYEENYKEHLKRHEKLKCDLCIQTFNAKELLSLHLLEHKANNKIVTCFNCEQKFEDQNDFLQHKLICKRKIVIEDNANNDNELEIIEIVEEKPNMEIVNSSGSNLTNCNEKIDYSPTTSKDNNLKKEISSTDARDSVIKNEQGSAETVQTSSIFNETKSDDEDIMIIDDPFKCQTCLKSFNMNAEYRQHMAMHAVENMAKCKICTRVFDKQDDLELHLLLKHSNSKP